MIKNLSFLLILLHTYTLLSDGQYMYYPLLDAGYYFEDFDYQEDSQEQFSGVTRHTPKVKSPGFPTPDMYPFKEMPIQTQIPAPVLPVRNMPLRGEYDYLYESKEYEPSGVYSKEQPSQGNFDNIVCKTRKRQYSHVTTSKTIDLDATNYKIIPHGNSFIVIDPNEYLVCSPTSSPNVLSTQPSLLEPARSSARAYIFKPIETSFPKLVTPSGMQSTRAALNFKRLDSFEDSSKGSNNPSVRKVSSFFREQDLSHEKRLVTQSSLRPIRERTFFDSFDDSSTPTYNIHPLFPIRNVTPKHRKHPANVPSVSTTGAPTRISNQNNLLDSSKDSSQPKTEIPIINDNIMLINKFTPNAFEIHPFTLSQAQKGKDLTNAFTVSSSSSNKESDFHEFHPHVTKPYHTLSTIKLRTVTPIYKYVSPASHFSIPWVLSKRNQSPEKISESTTPKSFSSSIPQRKIKDSSAKKTTKLLKSSLTTDNIEGNDVSRTNVPTPKSETENKITEIMLQTTSQLHSTLKTSKKDLKEVNKPGSQVSAKSPINLVKEEIDSENSRVTKINFKYSSKIDIPVDDQRKSGMTESILFTKIKNIPNLGTTQAYSTELAKILKSAFETFTPSNILFFQQPTSNYSTPDKRISSLSNTSFLLTTEKPESRSDLNNSNIKFESTPSLIRSTRIPHPASSISNTSKLENDEVQITTTQIPNRHINQPRTDVVCHNCKKMPLENNIPHEEIIEISHPVVFTHSPWVITNEDMTEEDTTQVIAGTGNFATSNAFKPKKDDPSTFTSKPFDHKVSFSEAPLMEPSEKVQRYSTITPPYDHKTHTYSGIQFRRLDDYDDDWDSIMDDKEKSGDSYNDKPITTTPSSSEIRVSPIGDLDQPSLKNVLKASVPIITTPSSNERQFFPVGDQDQPSLENVPKASVPITTTPSSNEKRFFAVGNQDQPSLENVPKASVPVEQNKLEPSSNSSELFETKPSPSHVTDTKFKTSDRENGKALLSLDSKPPAAHTGKTSLRTKETNLSRDDGIVRPLPGPPMSFPQPNIQEINDKTIFPTTAMEDKTMPESPLPHKGGTSTVMKTENGHTLTPFVPESSTMKRQVYSNEFKVKILRNFMKYPNRTSPNKESQYNSSDFFSPKRPFLSMKVNSESPIIFKEGSPFILGSRDRPGFPNIRLPKGRHNPKYQINLMQIKPMLPSLSVSTLAPYPVFFQNFSSKKRGIKAFTFKNFTAGN